MFHILSIFKIYLLFTTPQHPGTSLSHILSEFAVTFKAALHVISMFIFQTIIYIVGGTFFVIFNYKYGQFSSTLALILAEKKGQNPLLNVSHKVSE